MRILIAPNSFKECAKAAEIAEIIKAGLLRNGISDLSVSPVTDGGDGFLDICSEKFDLKASYFNIPDCFDDNKTEKPAAADAAGKFFVIEAADYIGLRAIPENKRDPLKLSSANLGELLLKITKQKEPDRIVIGIGGTGTTDLGLGICVPFGLKLFDKMFNELKVIPENYIKAEWIKLPSRICPFVETVLDVSVPVCGRNGSVMIFAKQKGVKDAELTGLDNGFKNILRLLKKDHRISFDKKLYGAGGSLAVGISLITEKLSVIPSRKFLLYELNLLEKIKDNDLIITGEGRFDSQSYLNKAPGVIISESLKRNKKAVLISGSVEIPEDKLSNKGLTIYDLTSMLKSKKNALKDFEKGITMAVDDLSEKIKMNKL